MSPFSPACYLDDLTHRKEVKQVKNFFGVKDINAARQRLKRVLKEGDWAVGDQSSSLIDGERMPSG